MNEKVLYQALMWVAGALACIAGLATVVLLVSTITDGLWLLIPTILLAAVAFGAGCGAAYFAHRFGGHEKVFANPIEAEVLTRVQRRDLRHKRGELVMQRAIVEIEQERDNIVHRQLEAAADPDKPPHKTRFGDDEDSRRAPVTGVSAAAYYNKTTGQWENL